MIAVIGDVHGCVKSLEALTNSVARKHDVSRFVILGDFVDRGACSLEVSRFIKNLGRDFIVTVLRGNHEDMLIDYLRGENKYPNYRWQERVGLTAIKSFSGGLITDVTDVTRDDIFHYFADYMPFFESSLDYAVERAGGVRYLFSHAGVAFPKCPPENQYDFCVPSDRAIKYPFIWSRNIMKFDGPFYDYVVVHGHIPLNTGYRPGGIKGPLVRKDKKGRIININLDTGCVYGGLLSAMLVDHTGKYEFETVKCAD